MPAHKALGAQEEAKKDLVDVLKMYMQGNLSQIPAYIQPNKLYTVQGTVAGKKHNKELRAPEADKEIAFGAHRIRSNQTLTWSATSL